MCGHCLGNQCMGICNTFRPGRWKRIHAREFSIVSSVKSVYIRYDPRKGKIDVRYLDIRQLKCRSLLIVCIYFDQSNSKMKITIKIIRSLTSFPSSLICSWIRNTKLLTPFDNLYDTNLFLALFGKHRRASISLNLPFQLISTGFDWHT